MAVSVAASNCSCSEQIFQFKNPRSNAQSMLRSKKLSWLKAWAMQIARRRGMKKAIVALARRLAVIMHRIWVDGTEFHWTREPTATPA